MSQLDEILMIRTTSISIQYTVIRTAMRTPIAHYLGHDVWKKWVLDRNWYFSRDDFQLIYDRSMSTKLGLGVNVDRWLLVFFSNEILQSTCRLVHLRTSSIYLARIVRHLLHRLFALFFSLLFSFCTSSSSSSSFTVVFLWCCLCVRCLKKPSLCPYGLVE